MRINTILSYSLLMTIMKPLPLALPLILFAYSAGASAQSASEESTLSEIRINALVEKDIGFAPEQTQTATKAPAKRMETPLSVGVVTREVIESRQSSNVQEALETVAGVSASNYGRRGFDDIFIRGFRSTESTLIDGLAQNPGMWTRFQQYGYDRFEVLKGAASLLYGQVQPGGIVNAISKRPKREDTKELGMTLGSFNERAIFTDVNQTISENGRTAFRINALYSDADDPTEHVFRRDRWIAPSLSLDLGKDSDLVFFSSYNQGVWIRQQGLPPQGTVLPNPHGKIDSDLFTGEPNSGPYNVEQLMAGYSFEHRFSPDMTLRHNVRYEQEHGMGSFTSNTPALDVDGRTQRRQNTRQALDGKMLSTDTSLLSRFQSWGLPHQLVTGIDARTGTNELKLERCKIGSIDVFSPVYGQKITCKGAWTRDDPAELDVLGFYAQDQIKLLPKLTALVGTRYEYSHQKVTDHIAKTEEQQTDRELLFSGGMIYELFPGFAPYWSYSESFLPTAGKSFDGNAFKPETGRQLEAGLKFNAFNHQLTGNLAAYNLYRNNVTTSDPKNDGYSIQTGQERSRGFELELGANWRAGFKSILAYTYTDTEVVKDTNGALIGKPSIMQPKHAATLWNTYHHAPTHLTYGLGLRYVGRAEGSQPFTLPSYTVVDAGVTYTGTQYRISAGVKNILDKDYYVGAVNNYAVSPGEPRRFTLTATYFF